jgi:hypothetical protein
MIIEVAPATELAAVAAFAFDSDISRQIVSIKPKL